MSVATHTLDIPGVALVYDVLGPLPTSDGRPPLLMIGQPMDATGFATLASRFPDRTVVTYDPRGLGRSTRTDGRVDNAPEVQAADVHALIEALGAGPVDIFGSSGGAVTALALVAAHPDDVVTLVAHEPPLIPVLPDAGDAEHARAEVRDAYEAKGWGTGMAAFMVLSSWRGEYTDDYFAHPAPDPAAFGMPTGDDGSRARPAGCGLPEPPRWVPRRRVRLCRSAGGLRAPPPRGPRRRSRVGEQPSIPDTCRA